MSHNKNVIEKHNYPKFQRLERFWMKKHMTYLVNLSMCHVSYIFSSKTFQAVAILDMLTCQHQKL